MFAKGGDAVSVKAQTVSYTRTLSRLAEGKNINPHSLLATDYLNHFNEIVMFLDMLPSMPECIDDVKEWQPKTYVEHFRDSVFTHKDLAITCYENAPPSYRQPFDLTVDEINAMIAEAVPRIEGVIAEGDAEKLEFTVTSFSQDLQKKMDVVNGIINATLPVEDHEAFGQKLAQSEIDALFD